MVSFVSDVSVSMMHWLFFTRHTNIPLYVPNLIGYLRLFCSIYAFHIARDRPFLSVAFYLISFICDDLDGRFARLLDQQSTLGTVLDMVTDRLSTAGLFILLSTIYQDAFFVFLLLLMLDIASHWCQMYYVLITGLNSHKEVTSKSWLIRTYYRYRIFMGICCISCEVLYLCLYLMHWMEAPEIDIRFVDLSSYGLHIQIPISFTVHSISAIYWIAVLATPGFVTKQVVNLLQLTNAMRGLVRHDLRTRTEYSKVH